SRARQRAHRPLPPDRGPGSSARAPQPRLAPAAAVAGGGARHLPSRPGGPDERPAPRRGIRGHSFAAGDGRERHPLRLGRRPRSAGRGRRARAEGHARTRNAHRCRAHRRRPSRRRGHRGRPPHPQPLALMVTPLKTRVLLADDHAVVRSGLRAVLDAEPDIEVVAEAADGSAAVREGLAHEVDLAILDVSMPKMTGLQATAELRRRRRQLRVLILSVHDNEQYFFEALRAGASGYVLKSAANRDLIDACRAAMRGEPFLYPN